MCAERRLAWARPEYGVSYKACMMRLWVPVQLKLTMRRVCSKTNLCHLPGILRGSDKVLVPVAGTRASKRPCKAHVGVGA